MEDISKSNTNINDDTTTVDPTEHVSPVNTPQQSNDGNPEDLDSRWLRWKCLNCGYLYEGVKELKKCPKCGNENPDLFEDAD